MNQKLNYPLAFIGFAIGGVISALTGTTPKIAFASSLTLFIGYCTAGLYLYVIKKSKQ